jgi:hypothetical protein
MWPGSYLHSWRKRPQGVEYVDPGESIQRALDLSQFVILAEGAHSAPAGLTMRSGQWLSGIGPAARLTLGGHVTLASGATISDMTMAMQPGYAAHGYAIRGADVSGVTLRNLEIDGQVAQQTYGPSDNGQSGVALLGASARVLIDSCHLHGFGKDCVYVAGAKNVRVSRSTLRNFSRGGVTSVDCDGLDVTDCLFEDGWALPTVIGNCGIWLEPNDGNAEFLRVRALRNTFRSLNRGVMLYNTQDVATSFTERDNSYQECRHNGVLLYYAASARSGPSLFEACGLVEHESGLTASRAAVAVFNSPGAVVDGHEFRDCGGELATVSVGPNCRGARVRRSSFSGDRRSAICASYVSGSDTRRRFTENDCAGGSLDNPGGYAAVVLTGTAQHPIDSDDVIENTVDGSYSGVHSGTNWTGGRNTPNQGA